MTISSPDYYINTVYLEFLLKKDIIKNLNDISFEIPDINWNDIFISQIAFNNKDYSKSKEFAIKIIQNSKLNPLLVAEGYNLLGRIARLYKLEEDAKAFYDSALLNFEKNTSFYGQFGNIRITFNQANVLLLKSELSKAIKMYSELSEKIETLKPIEQLNQEVDRLKLKIYQNSALTLLYQGKTDDSRKNFEKAMSFIPAVEGSSTEADLYLNYSNLTLIQENFEVSFELLSKAGNLYKKLDKIDLYSKIAIDKIKINLISGSDKLIDPLIIADLITYYEQARKTKEVNLKIVEIFELLYSQGKITEATELRNYLMQQAFLPDLRGRILYISMGMFLLENNFEEVYRLADETKELIKQLNDKNSILPVEIILVKAKYLQNRDTAALVEGLKTNVNQLLKMKDTTTAITIYEEFFPILFDQKNYITIIDILNQIEVVVFKKIKEKEPKEFHENDLILLYALIKDPKAKTMFKSSKKSFDDIKKISRYNSILDQNPEIEQNIKEFLVIA